MRGIGQKKIVAIQAANEALEGTDASCQCRTGAGREAEGCWGRSLGEKTDDGEEGKVFRWEERKGDKKEGLCLGRKGIRESERFRERKKKKKRKRGVPRRKGCVNV